MSFARAIATVGGITLLSRIAGFVRDTLMARILGAGPEADAFFVAFRLPNLFRSLFAEGAFTAAFLPQFKAELYRNGQAGGLRLAEEALAVMMVALLLFSTLMALGMPLVVAVLATGFTATPGQFELAVTLSRITFPYLALISLTALLGSILNAVGRFGPFAAAPILLNLVQIGGLLACGPLGIPAHMMLAYGVPAAGLAQLVWLAVACRRAGFSLRLRRPRLTPGVRRLFALLAPGIVGAGVYQFNLLIGTNLASWLPTGAVSYLQYADRLNQLPMAVIGVAIGTALLPLLSQRVLEGNPEGVREAMSRGLEFALLFGLPAAAALLVIPGPIVTVVFQGGAFSTEAADATSAALAAFAIGIPAFIVAKVLAAAFFARQDTRAPVRVAIIVLLANVAVSLALIGPLGHVGLALAPGLTAWLNVLLLGWGLYRRDLLQFDRRVRQRGGRILLATLGMAGILFGLMKLLQPLLESRVLLLEGTALVLLILGGLVSYAGLVLLLRASRLSEIRALFRRQPGIPPASLSGGGDP
jgi:putative peptidoglycan lipid II flippase